MIELQHLTKRFATQGGTVVALNDINLTIQDGDVYGIIGMSGAGKSTLVRCINMLERPDEGSVTVNGTTPAGEAQLVVLSQSGDKLHLEASSDAKVLLMAGEPLNEPIVGYGPFVMNSKTEIAEAIRDFNSGRFGQI